MSEAADAFECRECGVCYPIDSEGIIHAIGKPPGRMSVAQRIGQWNVSARLYEPLWRRSALSRLTGESFPPEREWLLVRSLFQEGLPARVLDNASATGFLGRTIASMMSREKAEGVVVVNDISLPMLRESVRRATLAGVADQMVFVLADSERLPFADSFFGGIFCGGSLNEFSSPRVVLGELARVMEPHHGRASFMFQIAASEGWRSIVQRTLGSLIGLTVNSLQGTLSMFADDWKTTVTYSGGLIAIVSASSARTEKIIATVRGDMERMTFNGISAGRNS